MGDLVMKHAGRGRGWRDEPHKHCGACKAPVMRPGSAKFCPTCGRRSDFMPNWRDLSAAAHEEGPYRLADLAGRPAGMGADEYQIRLALLAHWLTRPASDFLARLAEFADWLAEFGRPEEAAARADWRPRNAGSARHGGFPRWLGGEGTPGDPRSWWNWNAAVHPDWWKPDRRNWGTPHRTRVGSLGTELVTQAAYNLEVTRAKADARRNAGMGAQPQHNGTWFLAWPAGWVRFTQPAHEDARWWVTVECGRGVSYSQPYEERHPGGYARLFHGRREYPDHTPPLFATAPGRSS